MPVKLEWYGEEAMARLRERTHERILEAGAFLSADIKNRFQKTPALKYDVSTRSGTKSRFRRRGTRIKDRYVPIIKGNPGSGMEIRRRRVGGKKVYAPSQPGEPPAIQTGMLWRSIMCASGSTPSSFFVNIGPSTSVGGVAIKYARFLEFGTRKMRSRPYLVPALYRNRENVAKILGRIKI